MRKHSYSYAQAYNVLNKSGTWTLLLLYSYNTIEIDTSKRTHGKMAPVHRIFISLQIIFEGNGFHSLKD